MRLELRKSRELDIQRATIGEHFMFPAPKVMLGFCTCFWVRVMMAPYPASSVTSCMIYNFMLAFLSRN